MKPRKPLKRSLKPIKRIGKVGIRKKTDCQKALKKFFCVLNDSEANLKECQICGRVLNYWEADPAHKIRRSRGGKDTPDNLIAAHRGCHSFVDSKPHRYKILEQDSANLLNGKIVQWTPMIHHELQIFLSTGFDYAGNAGKSSLIQK